MGIRYSLFQKKKYYQVAKCDSMLELINPTTLIQTFGLLGIALCVFSESALFIGLFLPGDTLLFVSGFMASGGYFDIKILMIVCIVAAILGDNFGYWIGHKFGKKLFDKEESVLFKKRYLRETEKFYEEHGKYAIVLARFLPVIRAFVAPVAGISTMNYRVFLTYNIVGGVLWVTSLSSLGYFLGEVIPNPDKYILPIILGIIALSATPVLWKAVSYRLKK